MKLQYLTVMFIIIFLPIILVSTYYVQQQMESVTTKLSYDEALLDATHDAMSAFEINTANEDLSTVSDSLRSIIEASNNIFLNTLAINFGISNANKSFVQPYIPAILYSLYDGYYIYSPTYNPIVCTDKYGQTISTDSLGVEYQGTQVVDGKTIGTYIFYQDSVEYPSGSVVANNSTKIVNFDDLKRDGIETEYGQLLYETNVELKDGSGKTLKDSEGNTIKVYSTVLTSDTATSNYKTKYKISYILKSYVPYAATYSRDDIDLDITINYTLDNFISIMGNIEGVYYSKSGYLIDEYLIENITVNGNSINWYTYSDEELQNMAQNPGEYEIIINFSRDKNGNTISISNTENLTIDSEGKNVYWQDAKDAVEYYSRAWAFSKWIYQTPALYELEESDIVTSVYDEVDKQMFSGYKNIDGVTEQLLYDFSSTADTDSDRNDNESKQTRVFYKSSVTDYSNPEYDVESKKANPEDGESNFVTHKRHVIRNSITYNLCLAMTAYNEKYSGMTFEMPILQEEEWNKILSNVSIVTFMQGLNCGLKIYNNYAIVSSNNNEISVTPSEIFYTSYTASLEDGNVETVHRINCPKLQESNYYTSLKSKEIKYDKNYNSINEKFDYDHKVYTCYDCIVDPNYVGINGNKNGVDSLVDSIYPREDASEIYDYKNKLKAYYIAIGKERNNLYKPTEVSETTAIEIMNFTTGSNYNVGLTKGQGIPSGYVNLALPRTSLYSIDRISKLEITLDGTCVDTGIKNLYTTSLQISLNGNSSMSYNQVVIPVTSTTTRTIQLTGSFSSASKLNSLGFKLGNNNVNFNVKSVKIYYK